MDNQQSWAELISQEMDEQDDYGHYICTLTDDELKEKFDTGYGGSEGRPFTAWTKNRVYFPVVYDGAEWVGSAPRNPCDEATRHQGGQ